MKKHQQWGIEQTYLVEKMGRRIGAAQKVKQMKATWAINYGKQKKKNDFRLHDDDMMTFTILVLLTSTNNFFCSTTFSPLNDYLGVL